jgi:dihydrolipoamide dehydrogenase
VNEIAEVRVPDIGDFGEVPVIEILVAIGDEVAVEDPLVTLESDKATMDVPAPVAGVVAELHVAVGDRVSEGTVLLTVQPTSDGAAARTEGATAPDTNGGAPEHAAVSTVLIAQPQPADTSAGERDFDVVVLGAGPGGYTAAFRAADLGLRVALVERHDRLGGVCLNVGCIPSKALLHAARVIAEAQEMAEHGISFGRPEIDVGQLIEWKSGVVARLTGGLTGMARQRGVEVVHGTGRLISESALVVDEREITFANCIIATGSNAASIPGLPDDQRILDSTAALSPASVPERLLVIGGGIIGLEMACVYDALGSQVTVVEMLDQLIPGADPDLVRPLARRIRERYDDVLTGTRVGEIHPHRRHLTVEIEGVGSREFDQILVAVGRTPNGGAIGAQAAGVRVDERGFIDVDRQMRTNVAGIYAIGDVVGGPMLAHKATHEGKVAAEVIAGNDVAFDARTIPSVAYTDPEVAWMGLTERAARAREIEYEKAVFPWAASGRALALGRPDGLTKLLVEPGSRRVLGCGIVGVGAGDLIAEAVHALEMGADAQDLALTIHPHPTLSETVGLAAEMAEGTITDMLMAASRPSGVSSATT